MNESNRDFQVRVWQCTFDVKLMIEKDNEEAYTQMLELLLSSLRVEEAVKTKVFQVIDSANIMESRRNNTEISTEEADTLRDLQHEATSFLSFQKISLATIRIQSLWRRHIAMKKYKKYQQVYVKGRNTRVHDMLQREVGYTRLITQLAQRYAVPLLNTPDRALKDESQDIQEILRAIVEIERLHRFVFCYIFYVLHTNFILLYSGLLRKFRGFVEEGCDWPNIDGFGNIFLDLQEEFRAYGDFIKQFKYTIDLVDQMEIQETSRPRYDT